MAFSFLVDGDATEPDGVDGKSLFIVKASTSIHDAHVSNAIFSLNGVDLVHLPGRGKKWSVGHFGVRDETSQHGREDEVMEGQDSEPIEPP
jgi:hypothetical protein